MAAMCFAECACPYATEDRLRLRCLCATLLRAQVLCRWSSHQLHTTITCSSVSSAR